MLFGAIQICVALARASSDLDVGAVHVHLAISDLVKP